MEIHEALEFSQTEPLLPFLLIGGYAVAAHGHTRPTYDVDFMVLRHQRDKWNERFQAAGLELYAENDIFAQYGRGEDQWGLDLMFVKQETFDEMWEASLEAEFDGVSARVPSLDHVLALKLHALKQSLPHRTAKDAGDVEIMLRRNNIDLQTERYKELFLKYGTEEIYETFCRILRHP